MCNAFDRVILLCKARTGPPPTGHYLVAHQNLRIVTVPAVPTELGAIVVQPLVLLKGLSVVSQADVVHARMPDWTGLTGAFVAQMIGRPRFHQIIDDWGLLAGTIPLKKKFGLGALLRCALLIYDKAERALSRGQLVFAQGKTAYDKHVGASERVLILSSSHRATDIGRVTPRFGGETFRILSVGRLNTVKNHQLIIRALSVLRQRDNRWSLKILGEGAQRAPLMTLAEELGVMNALSMPGLVPHGSGLWAEYDQADVFVLASVSEGTPKVILEAMMRGCPIVASAVSGVPTAVEHEKRGLLFESGDLEGLVASLLRMATDYPLRVRCQQAAHAFSRKHALEAANALMIDRVLARWPQLQPLKST